MAEKKLGIVFTSDTSAARKGIADLNNALGTTEQKAKSSGAGLKTALGGLAIGAFVLDGVRALGEVERINAQTSAALKSTGAEAWITADAVSGLAGAIEKKTGIEAEAIQSGQNLLLTFTNIQNGVGEGNDIFDQATQTMADMSTAMGTDASTSAMQLGKALNDPIKGISALSKVGVTFTADQKAMVAEMVAAGDTMGAQKVILAELNKEFGGSAEAFGETLPGQIAKAKNSLGDMQESILVGALPAIEAGTKAVGGMADAYASLPAPVRTVTTLAVIGAAGWMRFGDSISTFGGHAVNAGKRTAELARTLSQGLDGVAATRGISKTSAAVEMLKSSASTAGGPTGKLSTAIMSISTGAGVAGIAVAGFGAMLYAWQDEQAKAAKRAKELESAIKGVAEEASRSGKTVEEVFSTSTLPDFIGENAKVFEDTAINMGELNAALQTGGDEWNKYAGAQIAAVGGMDTEKGKKLADVFLKLEGVLPGARERTEQLAKSNEELGLTIDPLTGKTVALADAVGESATKFGDLGRAVSGIDLAGTMAGPLDDIAGAAEAARQGISNFYDEITGNLSAQIEAEAALDSMAASLAANGTNMDINTEQGRANAGALISVKDAASGAAVEILAQGGSSSEAAAMMQGYVDRLNDTWAAAGMSKDEIAFMNATMGLTPDQIKTVIETNAKTVTTEVDAFGRKVKTLPNGHVIVTADTSRAHSALDGLASRISALGATLAANISRIAINAGQRAKGGPVERGEMYLVGEQGPELAIFGQDGYVLDADKTKALLDQAGAGGMKKGPANNGKPIPVAGDKGPGGPNVPSPIDIRKGPTPAAPAPAAPAVVVAAAPAKESAFDLTDIGQILERGLKAQTTLQKSVDGGVIGGIKTLNGWPPIQSVQLGLIHQAITSLGSRAGGGKVRNGTAYLVGEEGPEFVTFGADGNVIDAPNTSAMLARGGRGRIAGGGTQIVVNIHPNAVRGDGDIKQIVDGINRLGLTSNRPLLAAGIAG